MEDPEARCDGGDVLFTGTAFCTCMHFHFFTEGLVPNLKRGIFFFSLFFFLGFSALAVFLLPVRCCCSSMEKLSGVNRFVGFRRWLLKCTSSFFTSSCSSLFSLLRTFPVVILLTFFTCVPLCCCCWVRHQGRHMFVGISERTNQAGAAALAKAFGASLPVIPVPVVRMGQENNELGAWLSFQRFNLTFHCYSSEAPFCSCSRTAIFHLCLGFVCDQELHLSDEVSRYGVYTTTATATTQTCRVSVSFLHVLDRRKLKITRLSIVLQFPCRSCINSAVRAHGLLSLCWSSPPSSPPTQHIDTPPRLALGVSSCSLGL